MVLEWLELPGMDITVRCDPRSGPDLPGQIIDLLEAAADCGVGSITLHGCEPLEQMVSRSLDALLKTNPSLRLTSEAPDEVSVDGFEYIVISQGARLLLLRDERDERRYSIFIPATHEMVTVAARIAYLTAVVLGFPGTQAFDVRFSVHELLSNIVEHGLTHQGRTWIQTTLERTGDTLCISIIDKGIEFDPTAGNEFDLDNYLDSGLNKGLGLMMLRRMHSSFRYERKNGYNRVYFNRTMSEDIGPEQERKMMTFEIGEPVDFREGVKRIELKGDLDSKGALAMETLLGSLLERRLLSVVLDFEQVPFISSAGVGMLLGMVSTIREEGGEVWFAGMSHKVMSVLKLLNLQDFFKIIDAEEAKA
jgi:anti-sigma B factor antagonist